MKRIFISALITAMIATMFHGSGGGGRVSATDEPSGFDALRLKWKTMMTGGTGYDPEDEYIAARIADIDAEAQGYWETMETAADRVYLWSDIGNVQTTSAQKTSSYTRLSKMALAYATKGSALEGNTQLKDEIVGGLDWLYENAYNETMSMTGNWWDWEIGVPMKLNDTIVLLYDDLSAEQIGNYMKAVAKFVNRSKLMAYTGANRAWVSSVIGLMGVFQNNGQRLADARDSLSELFLYVTKGDGFYEDGSFVQHNTLPYNGGYGISLMSFVARLVNWLDGSEWEVTDPNQSNVIQWVYRSFEPFMHKGRMMDMTRGRELSRSYSTDQTAGQGVITSVMFVTEFAPEPDAAAFRSMVKSWIGQNTYRDYFQHAALPSIVQAKAIMEDPSVPERAHPQVYEQFAAVDRAVQVRPDYTFGLSMSSNRIGAYETINGENLRGWYTAEGMTYLYNNDISQYSDDFWPTVNPYRLPGTTVDTRTRTTAGANSYRHAEREAGGAEFDEYGTSAMKVKSEVGSLVARKSWFNFDDEIVALGAGIASTDNRTIETTVENRKLAGAGDQTLTVNGQPKPSDIGWTETMSDVHSIHLSGNAAGADIGYYFPAGAEVKGLREQRTGAWSQIDARAGTPSDSITRPYMTLWFDHGANPDNDTYEYALLPSKTAAETSAYADNPDIEILENTTEAQAVRDNSLNVTGYQFWDDAVKTVGDVTSNKRAAVMTKETDDEFRIAVSDPSQKNLGTINLEIARSATKIAHLDPGITVTQLIPTIQLSIQTGGSGGKTYLASFSFEEATAPPSAPAGLTVVPGEVSGQLRLNWEMASEAAGYTVKYGTSSGEYTETVDVGPTHHYLLTGLQDNVPYYVTVAAYNNRGESGNAEEQAAAPVFAKVIDNADASGVEITGEWPSSDKDSKYGQDYLHDDNTGRGAKSVRFTPELPAGIYKVSLWWVAADNRATAAPIEVRHAAGTESLSVNQRLNGGQWNEVGVYPFGVDSAESVTISNTAANGYVVADAVRFERIQAPAPQMTGATPGTETGTIELQWRPADKATGYIVKYGTASGIYSETVAVGHVLAHTLTGLTNGTPYYVTVSAVTEAGEGPNADEIVAFPRLNKIMDDADTEGITMVGAWSTGNAAPTTYGSSFIHDGRSGRGTKSVTFTPDLPAGTYKVYMWWTGHDQRATNVPVAIQHADGTRTVAVNQKSNGGQWNELGEFRFQGGESEYVRISNAISSNVYVEVDAVRFEQVLPVIPEVTEIVPGNGSALIRWAPTYDAVGYVIKYGTTSGEYSETIQVDSHVSSYSLPGLTNGTAYYVTVSALRAGGESPNAAEVEVTPQDASPPAVPGHVTATAVSESEVSLSWDAAAEEAGVAGYKVYRDGAEIVSVTDSVYVDSGLLPSTTYEYAVSAYDEAGNVSELSIPVSATTLPEEEDPGPGTTPNWPPPLPPQHTVNLSGGVPTIRINEVKLLQELQQAGTADTPLAMDLAALGGADSDIRKLELSPNALKLLKEHGKGLELRNEGIRLEVSPIAIATEGLSDPLVITVRKEESKAASAGLSPRSGVFSWSVESGGEPVLFDEPLRVVMNIDDTRNDQRFAVYAYNEATGEWTFVGGTHDAETSTVSFEAEGAAAYAVLGYSNPFADVGRVPWAQQAIDELAMRGIMQGTGADTFAPGRPITRAEFMALMNRLLKLDEIEDPGQFADVEAGAWYANAIATAFDAGLIQGDGERINPESFITREEMAVILMRAAAIARTDQEASSAETKFADDDEISLWAKAAIENATQLGLMNGKSSNRFDPKSQASRAEAAAVAYRMALLLQSP